MAKDPVCGMFVEEKLDSIRYAMNGKGYFFCSTQCLNEFRQPEKELKKLKIQVAVRHRPHNTHYFFQSAAHATRTIWSFTSYGFDA